MEQNDVIKDLKENTKSDEDIGWGDVKDELEKAKQPIAKKGKADIEAKQPKPDEDIGWDDVKDELEKAKQPIAKKGKADIEAKQPKPDEDIGWDDVKDELEKAKQPIAKNVKKEVGKVNFKDIKKSEKKDSSVDLDFILDIPLTVTVELGRGKLLIGELLQLGQGSVVELTKLAGEPMDIFVNDRLIARGEVVVVNEKFGVRLTDVVSTAERINKLK